MDTSDIHVGDTFQLGLADLEVTEVSDDGITLENGVEVRNGRAYFPEDAKTFSLSRGEE
jgi:MOSC domain-containing protein YiiM